MPHASVEARDRYWAEYRRRHPDRVRAAIKGARVKVREAVKAIRAATVCAECGRQPIDWHCDEHVAHPKRRVAHLVAWGYSLRRVLEEIARCTPLCRACHCTIDGRRDRLIARNRAQSRRGTRELAA